MNAPPTIDLNPKPTVGPSTEPAQPPVRAHFLGDQGDYASPSVIHHGGVDEWIKRQVDIAEGQGCNALITRGMLPTFGRENKGFMKPVPWAEANHRYPGLFTMDRCRRAYEFILAAGLRAIDYTGSLWAPGNPLEHAVRMIRFYNDIPSGVEPCLDQGGKIYHESDRVVDFLYAIQFLFESDTCRMGELVPHFGHHYIHDPRWKILTLEATTDDNTEGYALPFNSVAGREHIVIVRRDVDDAFPKREDSRGWTGGQWVRDLHRAYEGVGLAMDRRPAWRRTESWEDTIELVQSNDRYAANAQVEAGGVG